MNLTHIEKQAKRRELKLKGLSPQQVEIELAKIIKEKMEEEKIVPVEEEEPTLPGEAEPEDEDLSTVDTKD